MAGDGGETLPLGRDKAGARAEVKATGEREGELGEVPPPPVRPLETQRGDLQGGRFRQEAKGGAPSRRWGSRGAGWGDGKCFYCLTRGRGSRLP